MASLEDPLGAPAPVRILLVEHDPRAALMISEMFRSQRVHGLVLAYAEGIAEAAQELLDHGSTCVLLDVSLLGDQFAAIEQIRTAAPDVPIVALSDSATDQSPLRAIRAGAQDYLIKSELYPSLLTRAVQCAIERKRSEVQLAHQALHDPLTGLPNRALFLDRLGVAMDRSRRNNAAIAVLFLDVDNFKRINDSFGHAAGDRLLVGLSARLSSMLRPMDTVARFGGDEFTFLFEDLASEREVVVIAERISRIAALPIRLEECESSVTVSIGIAMVADPAITPDTVIREADAAMYRAKELGRSRFELYDEAARQRAMERLELETALRHAVERAELRVHYQPNISLGGRRDVLGLEALVRWEHPELGLISPREFIPLAEETGLVLPIGEYVLGKALAHVARWRRSRPEITVSVNLSARELEDAGLVSMLAGAIRASGIDPEALCLEVTEAAVARTEDAAVRALQGLKAMGVGIAIDDFASGSWSLQTLQRLPVDMLKIHESFVAGLGREPRKAPIIAALVELGHALGLRVVAKGVETDEQLAAVRALGCDGGQGFLLGGPVPEEEVETLLASLQTIRSGSQ